ncbi:MAG: hypothetical protein R3E39_00375 [Anaerolineae bacterium]
MNYVLLVAGMLICALLAVRSVRLLSATLWLAGVSVFTAIVLYQLGAHVIAVIELSLSVGLITILLVVAISMVGEESSDQPVSNRLGWLLALVAIFIILGLTVPLLQSSPVIPEASVATIFWQQRQADVVAQIAIIFVGVLGLLGLLVEVLLPRTNYLRNTFKQETKGNDMQRLSTLSYKEHEPDKEQV